MACGESNGHVTDVVTWPWKANVRRDPSTLKAEYLENDRSCYLATITVCNY